MGIPGFHFGFEQGEEDWDYAYLTSDPMFFFFLLPEKAKNHRRGIGCGTDMNYSIWPRHFLPVKYPSVPGNAISLLMEQTR